jgi:1-acyl-sn-glycerol-3-phosphate acyltransferase
MPLPPRWLRRVLWPLFLAVEAALLGLCVIVMVLALLVAPLTPRRRVLRLAAFAGSYLVMELVVLVLGAAVWIWRALTRRSMEWWDRTNSPLLRKALASIVAAARRTVGFELVIDQKSMMPSPKDASPLLVLCRHGGPGDSFAVVHLLLGTYQRRVRIVMKEALQWDPAIDLMLNRLSACFLATRSDGEGADQISNLTKRLRPGDALLLFPEGANWTPARRERTIQRLRWRRGVRAAWLAEQLSHVLPLRPAGVLSCLAVRTDLTVTVMAHTGLDKLVTVGSVWNALPIRVPMLLRSWTFPPSMIPRDPDAQLRWLSLEWAIVDEWIDAQTEMLASTTTSQGR